MFREQSFTKITRIKYLQIFTTLNNLKVHYKYVGRTMNPEISNKKTIEKDKHHISWKNHNIEQYIKKSLQEYLKIKEKRK